MLGTGAEEKFKVVMCMHSLYDHLTARKLRLSDTNLFKTTCPIPRSTNWKLFHDKDLAGNSTTQPLIKKKRSGK